MRELFEMTQEPKISSLGYCASITGVKSANLKGLDLELVQGALSLVCGPSGSGKTALISGTLEAEARRALLPLLPRSGSSSSSESAPLSGVADFEAIHSVSPVVNVTAFAESARGKRRVGDFLGGYSLLAKLCALYATPRGRETGELLHDARPVQVAERLLAEANCETTLGRLYLTAEVPWRSSAEQDLLEQLLELQQQGVRRFVLAGRFFSLPSLESDSVEERRQREEFLSLLLSSKENRFFCVIDRVALREETVSRFVESATSVINEGVGLGTVFYEAEGSLEPLARLGRGFLGMHCSEPHALRAASWFSELLSARIELNKGEAEFELFSQPVSSLATFSVQELREFLGKELKTGNIERKPPELPAWTKRLDGMIAAGLGRLSLARELGELSSAERLLAALNALGEEDSSGLIFVFDEPSLFFAPGEYERFLDRIALLLQGGNSIVLIEQQAPLRFKEESLLVLGPGSGRAGGEIVYQGKAAGFSKRVESREATEQFAFVQSSLGLHLPGVVEPIRAGECIVVIGKAGSGKTRLLHSLAKKKRGAQKVKRIFVSAEQLLAKERDKRVLEKLGIDLHVAKVFSELPLARQKGFSEECFLLRKEAGRCGVCKGTGETSVAMDVLGAGIEVCERCLGQGFQSRILEVLYQGRSIADVLGLSVTEAISLFSARKELAPKLQQAERLGLGYLPLGLRLKEVNAFQRARLGLARHSLLTHGSQASVYILDQVLAGLHSDELEKAVLVLRSLVASGNAVILSSHEPQLLALANRIYRIGGEEDALRETDKGDAEKLLKS